MLEDVVSLSVADPWELIVDGQVERLVHACGGRRYVREEGCLLER
jgi:hypothetical protein